jgi:hypothetical protein
VCPGTSELFLLKPALRRNRGVLRFILSIGMFKQDSISILIDKSYLLNKHYENALGGLTKLRNIFKQIFSQIMCVFFFNFTVFMPGYVVFLSLW